MTPTAFLAVFTFCVLIACPTCNVHAARILGFFPSPSKSQLIIHSAVANALAEAGHNVTVIATLPNINKRARYNFIHIDVPGFDHAFVGEMVNKPQPFYKRFTALFGNVVQLANESLSHPKMQEFLLQNAEGSFDLLILGYFLNDFHLGLAAHFKCPVIVSFTVQPIFVINSFVGNPNELAYVPTLVSGLKQPMTFLGRVKNFLGSMFEQYALGSLIQFISTKYYNYHFPAARYASFDAVKRNISLVLTNHHFSQGPIRPNVPAIIEMGGIQIKEQPDPLPSDIAQFLNNAKQGAIYVSFGSIVQGKYLSAEKAQLMFNVLSRLPFAVLWKWGDSDFPGLAANINYKSWLPQDDILAHPNVKLFITHGGQGSVVESQYHGVPMVGLPLFGDQPSNMANVQREGFGLKLDYITLTEQSFRETILEVLKNRTYAERVQTFSSLYRDRPFTPRQTVVYWVDYVLRHKGAKHLQTPAVYLNVFQQMSLDVIGFMLLVSLILVSVLVKLCKLLCCRGRPNKDFIKKHEMKKHN